MKSVKQIPRARVVLALEGLDPGDAALLKLRLCHGVREDQLARAARASSAEIATQRDALLERLAATLELDVATTARMLEELPSPEWPGPFDSSPLTPRAH